MNISMILIFFTIALVLWLGVRAQRGKDMNLEQWTVGGRGFGTAIVFLLMAGEIYTTFVFLGGSGYAYGHGGPAYYMLGYGSLCFVLSYWMLPPIWRYAQQRKLVSQPDFFAAKYASPALGILVAVVGAVALVPYLVLQLKGLGIIVSVASYSVISSTQGACIGAFVVTAYVMVSGVHGSAWTSVLKDILVMAVAIFLGVYLPLHYYGGIGAMFEAIEQAKPGFLALPAKGESPVWMVSTILLSTLGFYMWPHMFMASFSAQGERGLRKNAFVLPVYQLMLLLIFFVGFAAVLQVPGLKGADIDLALAAREVEPGAHRERGAAHGAGRDGRGAVLRAAGRPDHRGAAADGLQPGDAAVSGTDREPDAQQPRHPDRRVLQHPGRRGRSGLSVAEQALGRQAAAVPAGPAAGHERGDDRVDAQRGHAGRRDRAYQVAPGTAGRDARNGAACGEAGRMKVLVHDGIGIRLCAYRLNHAPSVHAFA